MFWSWIFRSSYGLKTSNESLLPSNLGSSSNSGFLRRVADTEVCTGFANLGMGEGVGARGTLKGADLSYLT